MAVRDPSSEVHAAVRSHLAPPAGLNEWDLTKHHYIYYYINLKFETNKKLIS